MAGNLIQPFLERQGFALLDGGLATEMEKRGADLDDELWSARMLIDAPEMIRQVHADFLKAGADLIATASYQASFDGFARAGYRPGQAERLMQLSVDLAVLARETVWAQDANRRGRLRPLVAASIGPYGACLHDGSEYHGNYGLGRQELIDFHRPRMAVLAATEADLFAFETIPSRLEAEALLELLAEFPIADCAALADASSQVIGVGVNCTAPKYVSALLESAAAVATPLLAYPNSGEQWDAQNQSWVGEGGQAMPVLEWYRRGARLIGGCCRTSMQDISSMRASLTEYVEERRAS